MEIIEDILANAIRKEPLNLKLSPGELERLCFTAEAHCWGALAAIRDVVTDTDLNDFECMEMILYILEELGIQCGSRHDF